MNFKSNKITDVEFQATFLGQNSNAIARQLKFGYSEKATKFEKNLPLRI